MEKGMRAKALVVTGIVGFALRAAKEMKISEVERRVLSKVDGGRRAALEEFLL